MEMFEGAAAAQKQPTMSEAVCWECGERLMCHEYVVCCTGTMFHICPSCEEKQAAESEDDERNGMAGYCR